MIAYEEILSIFEILKEFINRMINLTLYKQIV